MFVTFRKKKKKSIFIMYGEKVVLAKCMTLHGYDLNEKVWPCDHVHLNTHLLRMSIIRGV